MKGPGQRRVVRRFVAESLAIAVDQYAVWQGPLDQHRYVADLAALPLRFGYREGWHPPGAGHIAEARARRHRHFQAIAAIGRRRGRCFERPAQESMFQRIVPFKAAGGQYHALPSGDRFLLSAAFDNRAGHPGMLDR